MAVRADMSRLGDPRGAESAALAHYGGELELVTEPGDFRVTTPVLYKGRSGWEAYGMTPGGMVRLRNENPYTSGSLTALPSDVASLEFDAALGEGRN